MATTRSTKSKRGIEKPSINGGKSDLGLSPQLDTSGPESATATATPGTPSTQQELGPLHNLLSDDPQLIAIVATSISNHILSSPELFQKIVKAKRIIDQVSDHVYESVAYDNESTAGDIASLRDQNHKLLAENRDIVDKLDELEQYSRRNCLLLQGVPESNNENTDSLALDVINSRINSEVDLCDFDRTHRLGRRKVFENKPKPRPIIVKFTSYRTRSAVFRNKKSLKHSGFSITENLTSRRLKLLHEALRSETVWSMNGRIYCVTKKSMKKVVIKSESELRHL
ncbi:uncharacterized protein LOC117104831 [Anneissia japonica]|uniref:uncharacterized protein LOC117104831 n=1 Tax=Anneissia japonica TaxID=1529436 RepID=UPI001425A57B|nr:uncharacterized protein LOC117104831 [Anneissia japonica]